MAKKKKHKNKKHKQVVKEVKNTTKTHNAKAESEVVVALEAEKPEIESAKQVSAVSSDVRFSLLLLAIIIIAFGAIAVLLTNKSVSNSVYSLIKINL
jgi:hypothetical protein